MRIAVRAENLILQGPLPDWLRERADVTVQVSEDLVDPDTGERVSVLKDSVLSAVVPLQEGWFVLPRNIARDTELNAAGYRVIDTRLRPPRRVDLLEAAQRVPLRAKQMEAFEHAAAHDADGYLVLGTGRGKTVLSLRLAAASGRPALVFVDTGGLMEQWVDRATCEDLFALPLSSIGRCTGPAAQWTWKGRDVCLTTFQSFVPAVRAGQVPLEFLEYFGWVIFDEAHVAGSPTRLPLLSLFRCNRLPLTATPERNGLEQLMYLHAGTPLVNDRQPDLLPDVFIRAILPTRAPEYPLRSVESYGKMCTDMLGTLKRRPDAAYLQHSIELLSELQKRGRKTMVLSPRTDFLYRLADAVGDMAIIEGDVDYRYRPRLLLETPTVGVTTAIGEKALDRIDLDTLLMVVPVGSRAEGRLRQGAGRILRAMADKPHPELYILYPDVSYGRKLGTANAEMCRNLGFNLREAPEFDKEIHRIRTATRERAASPTQASVSLRGFAR